MCRNLQVAKDTYLRHFFQIAKKSLGKEEKGKEPIKSEKLKLKGNVPLHNFDY